MLSRTERFFFEVILGGRDIGREDVDSRTLGERAGCGFLDAGCGAGCGFPDAGRGDLHVLSRAVPEC